MVLFFPGLTFRSTIFCINKSVGFHRTVVSMKYPRAKSKNSEPQKL